MILRNGEEVKRDEVIYLVDKKGNRTETTLGQELEKIRKGKKIYTIKSKAPVTWAETVGGAKKKDYTRGDTIMYDAQFDGELWQYVAPGYRVMTKDGYKITGNRRLWFSGQQIFDKDQHAELIWFMLNREPQVRKGVFWFYDADEEDKKKAEINKHQAEAYSIIYSMESPVSVTKTGSEEALRRLASAWNVASADSLSFAAVQNRLWERISTLETNRGTTSQGYKEFAASVQKQTDTGKIGDINIAIERGILEFEDNTWYVNIKGGSRQQLVAVHYSEVDKYKDKIFNLLLNPENKAWLETVLESLKDNQYDRKPKGKNIGFEVEMQFLSGDIEYRGETKETVRDLFKKYEVKYPPNQSLEEAYKELREKINEAINN